MVVRLLPAGAANLSLAPHGCGFQILALRECLVNLSNQELDDGRWTMDDVAAQGAVAVIKQAAKWKAGG